jgi:hypothetical protein
MSNRECDDDYDRIVAQLGSKHRVIACSDDLQWIVQKKSSEWRSHHFCTSREGVIRWVKGLPEWETLLSLPERFPRRKDRTRAREEHEVDLSGHISTSASETGSSRGAS